MTVLLFVCILYLLLKRNKWMDGWMDGWRLQACIFNTFQWHHQIAQSRKSSVWWKTLGSISIRVL